MRGEAADFARAILRREEMRGEMAPWSGIALENLLYARTYACSGGHIV